MMDSFRNNIGIIAHCVEINNKSFGNSILSLLHSDYKKIYMENNYYYFNGDYPDIALSERESQCLFYTLRGKSAAGIAKILGLSFRTIESYLEGIKNKMGCSTKSELIEKSIEKDYIQIVPLKIIDQLNLL